jgi:hypothetical protein
MNSTVPRANGEIYFFRDLGQLDLLRLLPELIECRHAAKALRLWSAGCANLPDSQDNHLPSKRCPVYALSRKCSGRRGTPAIPLLYFGTRIHW